MITNTTKRMWRARIGLPLVGLTALPLLALAACDDQLPTAAPHAAGQGPLFHAESGGSSHTESNEDRPTPPDLSGHHNSHYSLSTLASALGNATNGAAQIVGFSEHGGHYQMAIHTSSQQGFPVEGSGYLVISSGNAGTVGDDGGYKLGSTFHDIGGIDVSVAVPSNASTLTFNYRFWAVDYLPYDDYFKAYLIAGATTAQIAHSDITSELATKSNGLQWSPTLRSVTVDVTAYRGQTVTLRFEAADKLDAGFASGAAVDNLRFDVASPPANQPPSIGSMVTPASGDEGIALAFSASATDDNTAAADLTYTWNFGDGTTATGASASHAYGDNGSYTVELVVTDGNGASSTKTATVVVSNVAPTAQFVNSSAVDEGTPISLSINASDVAADMAGLEYAFDCGSGYGDWSTTSTASCATTDDGTRSVRGKVKDKDGGVTESAVKSVTINNVAPSATFSAPFSANEGTSVTVSLSDPSDPSSADVTAGFTYAFNCGAGFGPFGPNASVTCLAKDNPSLTVGAKIKDKNGGVREYPTTPHVISVDNVNPVASVAGPTSAILSGSNVTAEITVNFSDAGILDTHEASVSCGSTAESKGTVSSGFTHSCSYSSVGTKTITVTVTDKDGGVDTEIHTVKVLYAFTGFFSPVNNLPTMNSVKAGSGIPVKFKLNGDRGLDIFAANSPYSSQTSCSATSTDPIELTVTAGSSSLSYDAVTGQYTYVWKTEKSWAGSCRTLNVVLRDGETYRANFQFTR